MTLFAWDRADVDVRVGHLQVVWLRWPSSLAGARSIVEALHGGSLCVPETIELAADRGLISFALLGSRTAIQPRSDPGGHPRSGHRAEEGSGGVNGGDNSERNSGELRATQMALQHPA